MNSKIFTMSVMAAGVLLSAGAASAQLTVAGAGKSWQSYPVTGSGASGSARAFWDNPSMDGAGNRTIGNYLTGTMTGGTPSGALPSPMITPSWLTTTPAEGAVSSSGMDLVVTFNTVGPVVATMRMEVAGYANRNELGWYDPSVAVGAESMTRIIFSGPHSAGASVTFTPTANFGIYLRTPEGKVFFSEAARNRNVAAADLAVQHFALFSSSPLATDQLLYIGAEDLALANTGIENNGDYNDMVFTLASTIPAPGAAALYLMGVMAMGRRDRREKAGAAH